MRAVRARVCVSCAVKMCVFSQCTVPTLHTLNRFYYVPTSAFVGMYFLEANSHSDLQWLPGFIMFERVVKLILLWVLAFESAFPLIVPIVGFICLSATALVAAYSQPVREVVWLNRFRTALAAAAASVAASGIVGEVIADDNSSVPAYVVAASVVTIGCVWVGVHVVESRHKAAQRVRIGYLPRFNHDRAVRQAKQLKLVTAPQHVQVEVYGSETAKVLADHHADAFPWLHAPDTTDTASESASDSESASGSGSSG
jgi:hypothetical protein